MIKIQNEFCENAKLDLVIKSFINRRLIGLVEKYSYENNSAHNEYNYDEVKELFPRDFPREQMPFVINGLLELMKAKVEAVPDLVMEYYLNAVIDKTVDSYDEKGISTKQSFSPKQIAVMEFRSEAEALKIDKNEYASSVMESIKDLRYYPEFLFWDIDFALLDEYSLDELKEKGISDIMGFSIPDYPSNVVLVGNKADIAKFWDKFIVGG